MRLATIAALIASLSFVGAASAADPAEDIALPSVYNWSGFYVGAHAGGAWSENCFTFIEDQGAPVGPVDYNCHDGDGWLAGGQIGANFQSGSFVYGIEGSASFSGVEGEHIALPGFPAGELLHESDIDSIFTLTARGGVAWDRLLIYGKAGLAAAHTDFSYVGTALATASGDDTFWGWTVGAGAEYGLTNNLSLAAEYNYLDLGDQDIHYTGAFDFVENVEQELHTVTLRLNYRFGY